MKNAWLVLSCCVLAACGSSPAAPDASMDANVPMDGASVDAGRADASSDAAVDADTIVDGGAGDAAVPPPMTVDPLATPLTAYVFQRLRTLAPTHTLIGQEAATKAGVFMVRPDGTVDWSAPDSVRSDIRTICGSGPAVLGDDAAGVVGDWWIGQPGMEEGRAREQEIIRTNMQRQHQRGGINTMAWHMANMMTDEGYRDGPRELWRLVPPESCPAVLAVSPGLVGCGSHFEKFRDKLQILATWMNTVVDAAGTPIPIIFRPFHENSGGWFWWGADRNPDLQYRTVFREIWAWMVEYMAGQGVHNLLWAISPNGSGEFSPLDREQYIAFTPGLDLVDVLGYDYYTEDMRAGDSGAVGELRMLVELARDNDKIAAMTEGGAPQGFRDYEGQCSFWTERHFNPILSDPVASGIAYYHMWTSQPEGRWWGPVPGDCSGDVDFRSICDRPDVLLEGDPMLTAE